MYTHGVCARGLQCVDNKENVVLVSAEEMLNGQRACCCARGRCRMT